MTSNFWNYESQDAYNTRQAESWANKARKDSFEMLAQRDQHLGGTSEDASTPLSHDNVFGWENLLSTKDVNAIEPPEKPKSSGGGSFLGGIGNALSSAADTAFLGPVSKPWDVLRPVQRLMEAEQKYVARPIAKLALSPLGDYDSLPGVVRAGAEVLADPLTYVGPGAVTKAFKLARLAPEIKLAAPAFETLFSSPGSKKALAHVVEQAGYGLASVGGEFAAEQVGAPGIVGGFAGPLVFSKARGQITRNMEVTLPPKSPGQTIINPERVRVYHGTDKVFDDVPDPNMAGSHYGDMSVKGAYTTLDSRIAAQEGTGYGGIDPSAIPTEQLSNFISEGAQTQPLVLKAGAKLFDPAQDPWPKGYEKLHEDYLNKKIRQFGFPIDDSKAPLFDHIADYMQYHPEADPHATKHLEEISKQYGNMVNVPRQAGLAGRNALVDAIKADGYQGIATPYEIITFDKSLLEPAYLNETDNAHFMNSIVGGNQGPIWQRPDVQSALKSDDAAMSAANPTGNQIGAQKRSKGQQLKDSIWIGDFNKKVAAGETPTEAEMRKANYILERQSRAAPLTGGPGAQSAHPLLDLSIKAAEQPIDRFGVSTYDELQAAAQDARTATQAGREHLGEWLGESDVGSKLVEKLRASGLRLADTDITAVINFYNRRIKQGMDTSNAVADTLRSVTNSANKSGALKTETINHMGSQAVVVTDPSLIEKANGVNITNPELGLMQDGQLHLEDLIQNHKLFYLPPEQQAVVDALNSTVDVHRQFAHDVFDLPMEPEAPNGYNVHRQLIKQDVPGPSGRMVESAGGPVVAQRFNAKQAFENPSPVASKSIGHMANNKYLPFYEAQSARVAQAYKGMADEYLSKAIDGMGKSVDDLLPGGLNKAIDDHAKVRQQTQAIIERLTVAHHSGLSGVWTPPKFTPINDTISNLMADATLANNITTKAARKAALKEVLDRAEVHYDAVKDAHEALQAEKSDLTAQIKSDPSTRGENPVEFHQKYYQYDTGQQLKELDKIDTPNGISGTMNTFNNSARAVMASLDASLLGVQGLVTALSHPESYIKMLQNMWSDNYYAYHDSLETSGKADLMRSAGVHWAARNDPAEFLFPNALTKIPVIGKAMDVSNAWFTQGGNTLRAMNFEAGYRPGMTQRELEQLGRTVNLISGFSPNDPSSIEKTMMFAPRFTRSTLGLIADSFTKHDFSNAGAARAMSSMVLSGVLLTHMLNKALGNDTDMDPTSSNFLRIRFGGQDVSLFGPWDGLARAVSKATLDGDPVGALSYLARTKASPIVGKMFDVIQGQTMSGQQLDGSSPTALLASAGKMAEGLGPISLTQFAQNPPDPTDPQSIGASAIQFLGTKATPLSPTENMAIKRNGVAQTTYGKPWDQIEPFQQEVLRKKYDLQIPSQTDIAKQFDYRRAISERYQGEQEKLDTSLPPGKDWVDAYHNLRHEQVGAFAQWAQQNPDALAQLRHGNPKNANDAALQNFYALFDQADKENWSPQEIDQRVTEYQDALSPDKQAYIERNTGLKDTARVKEYKAAQVVLKPYWNMADQVWDRLKTRLPGSDTAPDLQTYTNNLIQKLQDEGVPDSLIVKRVQSNRVIQEIDRATSTLRERYKARHPDVARLLTHWYGYAAP